MSPSGKKKKKKKTIDVRGLIQLIREEGIDSLYCVRRRVFTISPKKFLSYAKEDVSRKGVRGRINALCNAKRAIECRVDTLLYNHGLSYFAKKGRWSFPMKMEKLSQIGITIPNVLQNMITSKRNLLEHEYVVPRNQGDVQDIIDIAELFLLAGEGYPLTGHGALAMVNSPPGWKHSWTEGEELATYVILFNLEEGSLRVYKDDWKGELKVKEIGEEDMIELINAIGESDPSMQGCDSEESWDETELIKLAEEMIS